MTNVYNISHKNVQGRVKWFNVELKYGFIVPDTSDSISPSPPHSEDVFLHLDNCLGHYVPMENDIVAFDIGRGVGPIKKKKPRSWALSVSLIRRP